MGQTTEKVGQTMALTLRAHSLNGWLHRSHCGQKPDSLIDFVSAVPERQCRQEVNRQLACADKKNGMTVIQALHAANPAERRGFTRQPKGAIAKTFRSATVAQ